MELWKTRGRWWSTRLVGDLHPGPGSSSPGTPALACPYLFFSATNGADGFEPWSVQVMDGADVEVADQVLRDGRFVTACHTLRLGYGVHVAQGGRVRVTAGESIALDNGFSVGAGASFTASLDRDLTS
jgi:ELWxxDGT repeat protein